MKAKGKSYVYIQFVNKEDWVYCTDMNDNSEFRFNTLHEALENEEFVKEQYDSRVYIMKESRELIKEVS